MFVLSRLFLVFSILVRRSTTAVVWKCSSTYNCSCFDIFGRMNCLSPAPLLLRVFPPEDLLPSREDGVLEIYGSVHLGSNCKVPLDLEKLRLRLPGVRRIFFEKKCRTRTLRYPFDEAGEGCKRVRLKKTSLCDLAR
jgi:hypothetical protein